MSFLFKLANLGVVNIGSRSFEKKINKLIDNLNLGLLNTSKQLKYYEFFNFVHNFNQIL